MNKKFIAYFEMFLMLTVSFSIAHSLNEDPVDVKKVYGDVVRFLISDKNIVSAEEDYSTCIRATNGAICQQFPSSRCQASCGTGCVPATRDAVAECALGTCYDPIEGTCQGNSPKASCESNEGKWFNDPFENINQCKEGCCVIGAQTKFITNQQCARQSLHAGVEKEFHPEIITEIACLAFSNKLDKGACVFEGQGDDGRNACSFGTLSECDKQSGNFYSGFLCTHPDLNTTCERQKSNGCVEGKDEVYWFDSCGNIENIYDSNKVKSWNDGKVLPKGQSCQGGGESCGNCDYLAGSICANKNEESEGDFVDLGNGDLRRRSNEGSLDSYCKVLSCNEAGASAKHGESWCIYQSSIGVEDEVSTDVPGSLHFRKACVDGEFVTEPCGDYRNEICVQNSANGRRGAFREAACRPNRWQECLDANSLIVAGSGPGAPPDFSQMEEACEANIDCFIKDVTISPTLTFKWCSPKYPAGFQYGTGSENIQSVGASGSGTSSSGSEEESDTSNSEGICGQASQTCDVIYVKELSGWVCQTNCECETAVFGEQLLAMCVSLGDCGPKFNLAGEQSDSGVTVVNSPVPDGGFLEDFIEPIPGKYAEPGDYVIPTQPSGFDGLLDRSGASASSTGSFDSAASGDSTTTAGSSGAAGLNSAGTAGSAGTAAIALLFRATGEEGSNNIAAIAGAVGGIAGAIGSIAGALGGGSGAAGGTAGGVAGGTAGFQGGAATAASANAAGAGAASGASGGITAAGAIGAIAGVIAIVAIIIALVVALLGLGKTKIIKVTFTCQSYMPPSGGENCAKCGITKDPVTGREIKLPCSNYACSALGQSCTYINEGTDSAKCIDGGANDASSPVIAPHPGVIAPENSYQTLDNGVRIVGSNNGCIKELDLTRFGLRLNEPGQCKLDIRHTNSFEEMRYFFGGRNLLLTSHTMSITIPTLASLGIDNVNPNARSEYNLYVRCRDAKGNTNAREYVINFCVSPGDDISPPVVIAKEPAIELIKFNATSQNASVYTNEPSQCRWSSQDKDYDIMENEFKCANKFEDQTLYGWKCSYANFPIAQNISKFFVRCKDQPWQSDDTKRNKSPKSYELVFSRVTTPLTIISAQPNRTVSAGVSPATITLEVETAGGAEGGRAACQMKFGRTYSNFLQTTSIIHKQPLQLAAGNITIPIRCGDVVGNLVEKNLSFDIQIDRDVPTITRVYNQGGQLNVITNEPSTCYYNVNTCEYEFTNASLMTGEELMHTIEFDEKLTYNIRCKDIFGNAPGTCTLMVTGAK